MLRKQRYKIFSQFFAIKSNKLIAIGAWIESKELLGTTGMSEDEFSRVTDLLINDEWLERNVLHPDNLRLTQTARIYIHLSFIVDSEVFVP